MCVYTLNPLAANPSHVLCLHCPSCQAERLLLELETTQDQLNLHQQHTSAHAQALGVFFKHKAKAAAATAQQQCAAAVLCAWQQQGAGQHCAGWAWRALADKCLQQLLQQQLREQGLVWQCRRITGGSCRAAVASHRQLSAAFRSWHMLAAMQRRVEAVQQVGEELGTI